MTGRRSKLNAGSKLESKASQRTARQRKLRLAVATAVVPFSGLLTARSVRAANTVDNYTGSATGNVTLNTNWSTNAVPAIGNDAVFPVGAAAGVRNFGTGNGTTVGPSLVVGSLDDLSTSGTVTIQNITTSASAVTITLGGTGELGNSVSGNSSDLFYVATGGTFNITGTGGTGATLGLVLGQNSGNFNIAGTSTISAIISDTSSGFGFNKIGVGALTLSGANSYTGTTGIQGGTVTLSGSLAATSSLSMNGGTLAYTKAASTQNVANTTINAWSNFMTTVTASSVGLGNLTQTAGAGATVDLTAAGTGNFTTSSTTNTGGIIGGWATFGGTTWAVAPGSSGGAVTGLSSFETTTAGGNTSANYTNTNVDVTSAPTLGGAVTVNSIRFNAGANTLALATGNNTISSGGILVGSGATSGAISGGNITAGTGNTLYVMGSKALTISSSIVNNGSAVSLVDSNSGGLTLSTANSYTGNTYINTGTVGFGGITTPFGVGGTIFLGSPGNSGVVSIVTNNTSNTFSNPITVEPGGRRYISTTVGGSPTYSGNITLVGGATLEVGPNSNTAITLSGGATGTGNIIFGPPQSGRTANLIASGSNPINITGTISDNDNVAGGGGSNTGTVTVSAPIQGATAVLQNSTTEQFLLSGNNSFTGNTSVTAGTLEFVKAASTGSSPISVGASGTLAFNVDGNGGITNGTSGNGTIGGLFAGLSGTGNSTISYTAGSILALDPTNATGSSYSYAGNITTTPTTTVAKIGTGTLIFSGVNSYSAATKVNAGTLQFANPTAFSGSSAITVASGAILGVNAGGPGEFDNTAGTANGTIGGLFVGNGGQSGSTITYTAGSFAGIDTTNAGGNFTYSDTIGAITPGVEKHGTGALILSGNNTYTTPTLVNAGTLQAGVTSVAGVSGAFGLNSAVTLANVAGATLALNGFNTQIGSLAGGGGTGGNVTLGAATLTTGDNNTGTTYSAVISGAGGVVKNGIGTWTTSLTQSYTGGLTINNGSVAAANGTNAFGSTGNFTLGQSGTANNVSYSAAGFNNPIIVNPGLVATPGSATRTISPNTGTPFNITGNITLVGGASLTVSSSNATITVTGGATGTGNIIAASSNQGTVFSTGALNMTGLFENLTNSANSPTVNSVIGVNVTGVIENPANAASALILTNANTFFGDTTITKGVVNLRNSLALQNSVVLTNSTAGAITFGNSTTVGLATATLGGLSGNGNVSLNDTLTVPGAVALKIGNSNTLLSSTNTITGGNFTNTLNPIYSGILSNGTSASGASVTKLGNNTQTFTGANTYSGGTTISAGTLAAVGTGLGNGSVTLAGGTIAVNDGVATGNQTLNTGNQTWKASSGYTARIFDNGTSDQMLLTLQGNSTLTFDSSISTTTPFTVNGSAGNATLTSTTSRDWVIAGNITNVSGLTGLGYATPSAGSATVLATASDAPNSSPFVLNVPASLFTSGDYSAGTPMLELEALGGGGYSLDIVYNATPEPGTAMLLLAGGLPILTRRRRRRTVVGK